MFKWIKNKFKKSPKPRPSVRTRSLDGIEYSLWEIKEEYDLETEEVERIVNDKRSYLRNLKLRLKNSS